MSTELDSDAVKATLIEYLTYTELSMLRSQLKSLIEDLGEGCSLMELLALVKDEIELRGVEK